MADAKITQLSELTSVANEDLLAIVDDPSGTPITKKVTVANLIGLSKIEEQTPSGTGTITFSSLGAFTHLEIRYSARSTKADTGEDILIRFNADSDSNYDTELIYNSSATTAAGFEALAGTSGIIGTIPAANATANRAGSGIIYINDYRGITFNKLAIAPMGYYTATATLAGNSRLFVVGWRSIAAITSITILLGSGNYASGCKFSLYGIR